MARGLATPLTVALSLQLPLLLEGLELAQVSRSMSPALPMDLGNALVLAPGLTSLLAMAQGMAVALLVRIVDRFRTVTAYAAMYLLLGFSSICRGRNCPPSRLGRRSNQMNSDCVRNTVPSSKVFRQVHFPRQK